VAIAAVRRLAANGAIWVIGGFNESNGSKEEGSQFRAKPRPALEECNWKNRVFCPNPKAFAFSG
jgi:hypothetical protein